MPVPAACPHPPGRRSAWRRLGFTPAHVLVAGALGGLLAGCGGSSKTAAAAPTPGPRTPTDSPSAAASPTSAAPSPSRVSPSASTAAAGSVSGGAAGDRAVPILPSPKISIGPAADKGGAKIARIPGARLGILGRIPAGKPYPVGPIGAQGVADSGTWPDACRLLSDRDIKTLLPRTGKPTRKGRHGAFLGGGETKHFASCEYGMPQPGDSTSTPTYVQINLNSVADPAAVNTEWTQGYVQQQATSSKYPEQFMDYSSGRLGGARCYYDGNAMRCAKGHFSFTIFGDDTNQNVGTGNAAFAWITGFTQQVDTNVAKTLALRMS